MSEFLDDEWIASWVGRGTAPGPTATVQVVVTGADVADDGKWHLRLDDGVVTERRRAPSRSRPHAHAPPYPTARRWRRASSTRASRSCRARMKTAGDPGLVLDVLAGSRRAA